MKNSMNKALSRFALCAILVSPFNVLANEKRTGAEVKEVTVFLSGAQVTTESQVSLSQGHQTIVIEGLSSQLQPDNLQARGEGNFTILSVVKRMVYTGNETENLPKPIRLLQDSLDNMQRRSDFNQSLRKIYDQEEQMLLSNKSIGGSNTGVNVMELEKAANFFRNRFTELQNKRMDLNQKDKKLNEQIAKVRKQLVELNAKRQNSNSEVEIAVFANSAGTGKISLSYVIPDAGWTPYYDIRAVDTKSPVKIEYRARVRQNSGEDWNKIKLTLSTGNPTLGGSKPSLNIWFVNIADQVYKPIATKSTRNRYEMAGAPAAQEVRTLSDKSEDSYLSMKAMSIAESVVVTESQTTTSFEIAIPYTVPSDNKEYIVEVQNFSNDAQYRYYCAPKLDKDAFLIARLQGWDQYNLLSGEANIFYEGMFVGKSLIDVAETSDTLELSLGRDKNVVVTREKLKEFSERRILGSSKKETHAFDIVVRNKKKQGVEIVIEDQIPVSKNKELEVEVIDKSNAYHIAETGRMIWKLKLEPNETRKLKFAYSLKYPKDKFPVGF
jgi:uncharacterized protein (TIGR02231 family)